MNDVAGVSFFFLILVGLSLIVPTAMIVMGWIHLHQCPVEPNVPIYLIVGGKSSFVHNETELLVQFFQYRSLCIATIDSTWLPIPSRGFDLYVAINPFQHRLVYSR